ncbi:MAG: hypothetical protein MUF19_03745 [Candidatus Pacebacteria bacterium]|jgi:hypothetical protein|nr:hypothetical protein [Candidatus Paceibacterota bacterium]
MKNIIIIGALLLVAAGSWWAFSREADTEAVDSPAVSGNEIQLNTTAATDESEAVSGKGSLLSLLGMGKSQECSFVVRVDGMVQEGTAFYDGGNARVDTLVSGVGTEAPIASYMIMDAKAKTMYMWGSAQGDQGIKMTLPEADETAAADTPTSGSVPAAGVTPDMDVDYNCKPWRVDGSVFVPPNDVEFMDMSAMQEMMQGMGDMMR